MSSSDDDFSAPQANAGRDDNAGRDPLDNTQTSRSEDSTMTLLDSVFSEHDPAADLARVSTERRLREADAIITSAQRSAKPAGPRVARGLVAAALVAGVVAGGVAVTQELGGDDYREPVTAAQAAQTEKVSVGGYDFTVASTQSPEGGFSHGDIKQYEAFAASDDMALSWQNESYHRADGKLSVTAHTRGGRAEGHVSYVEISAGDPELFADPYELEQWDELQQAMYEAPWDKWAKDPERFRDEMLTRAGGLSTFWGNIGGYPAYSNGDVNSVERLTTRLTKVLSLDYLSAQKRADALRALAGLDEIEIGESPWTQESGPALMWRDVVGKLNVLVLDQQTAYPKAFYVMADDDSARPIYGTYMKREYSNNAEIPAEWLVGVKAAVDAGECSTVLRDPGYFVGRGTIVCGAWAGPAGLEYPGVQYRPSAPEDWPAGL